MFLQGNFQECPLVDLLAILATRSETGRLDINLQSSTAQLYLVEGKPVDCCVGHVKGKEALELLMSNAEGTFRFATGVAPPNIMFRKDGFSRLESASQEVATPNAPSQEQYALTKEIAAESRGRFRSTTIVLGLATIAGAVGLTIGSVIANIQHRPNVEFHAASASASMASTVTSPQPASSPTKQLAQELVTKIPAHTVPKKQTEVSPDSEHSESLKTSKNSSNLLSIPVVLRIEDGRVVEAYPAKPQPGFEAYEATAVRLARQRRFNVTSGTETIYLTITKQ